eukprot:4016366-Alexandrium_andersonii.AAC.1
MTACKSEWSASSSSSPHSPSRMPPASLRMLFAGLAEAAGDEATGDWAGEAAAWECEHLHGLRSRAALH